MISSLGKMVRLFGLVIIVSSCNTLSTLKVDVIRPATYSVPPEIVSVVVVDDALPFYNKEIYKGQLAKGLKGNDSLWQDSLGIIGVAAMVESLKEKAFFDSVWFHPVPINRNYRQLHYGEIPSVQVDSLCKTYNAQAVISLEAMSHKLQVENIAYYYQFETVYTPQMIASGAVYWKMYQANSGGKVLDAWLQKDTIFWNADLPTMTEAVKMMYWHMGEKASRRFAPYWESVNRYCFTGGNPLFLQGVDHQKANNWDEAAKVWYYIYENGTKKDRARAAFNLALSWEMRGDFEEALAWADRSSKGFEDLGFFSYSVHEKNIADMYLVELSIRKQQKKRLDEQIGPLL